MRTFRGCWAAALSCACVCLAAPTRPAGDAFVCGGDEPLQQLVERELDTIAATPGTRRAVVVIVEASTGLALAWGGRDGARPAPWLATRETEAGSVMKSFTLAAALEAGLPAQTRVDTLSLEDVLARSSNQGAEALARQTGREALARVHQALRLRTRDIREGDEAAWLGAAVGTSLSATPLQLTTAFAAFADDGRVHPSASTSVQAIKPETARTVRQWLRQAVARSDGTAHRADRPGLQVAGKTGTVQPSPGATLTSFIGFLSDRPRYVVYVGIETTARGASGGTVAAPAAARVLARLNAPR